MSNGKVNIVISDKRCNKCNSYMEYRSHKEITDKILSQPYYFKYWHYCSNCGVVQHYEEAKVINNKENINKSENLVNQNQVRTIGAYMNTYNGETPPWE